LKARPAWAARAWKGPSGVVREHHDEGHAARQAHTARAFASAEGRTVTRLAMATTRSKARARTAVFL